MDIISKRRKGVKRDYKVYHRLEADEEKIQYKNWRDCEDGDWALTDDDYVCEVLQRKEYTDKKGRTSCEFVFPIGRMWNSTTAILEYLPRKEKGNFNTVKPQTHMEREAKNKRAKETVQVYASMLVNGVVDYEKLGKIYREDQIVPEATVRKFLRQEEVQPMIRKEIDTLLKEKGITEGFALDLILEATELARRTRNATTMLKCAQEIQELLGMRGNAKLLKTKETQEITASPSILGLIDRESEKHEKVKLKRSLEKEEELDAD